MPNFANIRLTQLIPFPPARIWQALTEPALLAKWWAPGDIRPLPGHRFALDMGPWGKQRCEVKTVEAPRQLAYTYAEGVLDTTLTWSLAPEGDGTRLTMDHDGFNLDTPAGQTAYQGMVAGWPVVLSRIGPALAGA